MGSSNGLNVGDVTGPRWAGGTRNPDGAEKAWRDLHPNVARSPIFDKGFNAGRASRDAEVAVLREQLAAAELAKADAWDEGYDAGYGDESFDARGLPWDPDADEHPHSNPYRTGDNR